jgi:diguanylate cyclase (GGDEF)-like protein
VALQLLSPAAAAAAELAARYGGEEFAMILPDTDLGGALKIAEAAREAVAETCSRELTHSILCQHQRWHRGASAQPRQQRPAIDHGR